MNARALAVVLLLHAAPGAAAPSAEEQRYFYEEIFLPFFAPDPGRPDWLRNNRPRSRPAAFPRNKAPGTLRVFLIGGSIAGTLAAHARGLDEALAAALPSLKIELIPCGMGGYDSYREAMVIQEVLDYQPDLIVLLTGHNEYLGSPPVPIWIYKTGERLRRWEGFRELVKRLAPELGASGDAEKESERRDQAFERNLEANLRHPLRRGVPVAVISPPLNYRDAAPSAPLPLGRPEFLRGFIEVLKGDCAAARPWLDAAAGLGGRSERAKPLFFKGRCSGPSSKEALAIYRDAAALDIGDPRCAAKCQRTIRAVAAREGAVWADVDGAFLRDAAPGIPGLDRFEDKVHWRAPLNAVVSLEIVRALERSSRLASWPWDRGGLKALEARWRKPLTDWEALSFGNTLKYACAQMSFGHDVNWQAVFLLKGVFDHWPWRFSDLEKLHAELSEELRNPPPLWRFLWHAGEMLALEGRPVEARRALKRALELADAAPKVAMSLARAEAAAGDAAAARDYAKRALRESTGAPGADAFEEARALLGILDGPLQRASPEVGRMLPTPP